MYEIKHLQNCRKKWTIFWLVYKTIIDGFVIVLVKVISSWVVVAYIFNSSTQEGEAERSL